jgi:hypothetical protein
MQEKKKRCVVILPRAKHCYGNGIVLLYLRQQEQMALLYHDYYRGFKMITHTIFPNIIGTLPFSLCFIYYRPVPSGTVCFNSFIICCAKKLCLTVIILLLLKYILYRGVYIYVVLSSIYYCPNMFFY